MGFTYDLHRNVLMSKLLSHERSNYISNSEIPIAGTTGECMANGMQVPHDNLPASSE